MNLTELTFQLLVIALPGIIAYFLVGKFQGRERNREKTLIFLEIFLFSIFSYMFYAFMHASYNFYSNKTFESHVFNALKDINQLKNIDIFFTVIVSIFVSILWTLILKHNIINRFAEKFKISKRDDYFDLWDYYTKDNLYNKGNKWIIIRDYKLNLSYICYIRSASDFGGNREILIKEVEVYQGTKNNIETSGKLLYTCEEIYLSRNHDELQLEMLKTKKK